MKITGAISSIGKLETFQNGKQKQSIVIYTYETKPREFEIHFYSNFHQLDKLHLRDRVVIKFTLESEVFEDKTGKSYFTHIIGLEIVEHKRY